VNITRSTLTLAELEVIILVKILKNVLFCFCIYCIHLNLIILMLIYAILVCGGSLCKKFCVGYKRQYSFNKISVLLQILV